MILIEKYANGKPITVLDRMKQIAGPSKTFDYRRPNQGIQPEDVKNATNRMHKSNQQRLVKAKQYAKSVGKNPDNVDFKKGSNTIAYTPGIIESIFDEGIGNNDLEQAEYADEVKRAIEKDHPSSYRQYIENHPNLKTAAGAVGAIAGLMSPTGGGKVGALTKAANAGMGYLAGQSMVENPDNISEAIAPYSRLQNFKGVGNGARQATEMFTESKAAQRATKYIPKAEEEISRIPQDVKLDFGQFDDYKPNSYFTDMYRTRTPYNNVGELDNAGKDMANQYIKNYVRIAEENTPKKGLLGPIKHPTPEWAERDLNRSNSSNSFEVAPKQVAREQHATISPTNRRALRSLGKGVRLTNEDNIVSPYQSAGIEVTPKAETRLTSDGSFDYAFRAIPYNKYIKRGIYATTGLAAAATIPYAIMHASDEPRIDTGNQSITLSANYANQPNTIIARPKVSSVVSSERPRVVSKQKVSQAVQSSDSTNTEQTIPSNNRTQQIVSNKVNNQQVVPQQGNTPTIQPNSSTSPKQEVPSNTRVSQVTSTNNKVVNQQVSTNNRLRNKRFTATTNRSIPSGNIIHHSPILENNQDYRNYINNLTDEDAKYVNSILRSQGKRQLNLNQIRQLATDNIAGTIHDIIGNRFMNRTSENPTLNYSSGIPDNLTINL